MSLFSALQLGNNALQAQQIGLQVTGQNIANANTPGYIREDVVFTPAPTQRIGGLLLGLGVEVTAIIQKIDKFVEERLRGATSDRAGNDVREQTFLQLESVVGELSDTDLSTAIDNFFGSIHEVLNQPDSVSVRNLAVLQGETLAGQLQRLNDRILTIRNDLNKQVGQHASDINRLTDTIAKLNIKIAATEGGDTTASDAVGLRDQRNLALSSLAELVDFRSSEQVDGTVTVFVGGDYLVFQGQHRDVKVRQESIDGLLTTSIDLTDSNSPLEFSSGKIAGLIDARDIITGEYLEDLNSFTSTLVFEFNKLFSSGQGLKGYKELTSEFAINNPNAALDAAGLTFTPVNGAFQIQAFNRQTGLTKNYDITVDLNGLDQDTSLANLAAQIDAADGVSAQVTAAGRLKITSESADIEFAFADDTSGVLAALGVNTFFSGTSAVNVGVSKTISKNPALFSASDDGIGGGTGLAIKLAGFLDRPLESAGGETLTTLYDSMTSKTTQAAAVSRGVAEGARVFEETLRGQQLGVSGVSIDEEAVKLITYQRAYQAMAKFIRAVADLLDILVNL
ncbi:MAG: flagellar hook-associated protein FlgK [Pirellulales bacterium]